MIRHREQYLEYQILEKIADSPTPLGANFLALTVEASQATIGRFLLNLEHQGYLEKSSNKGRVITETGKQYLKQLNKIINMNDSTEKLINFSLSQEKSTLLDVLYTRKILEKETAFQAAKKITDEQINMLTSILNKQQEQIKQGYLGEKEDLEFHCNIAKISGNKVIEQILNLILTQKNIYMDFNYIRHRIIIRSSNDHVEIAKALAQRNSELASKLMVNHIDLLIEDIHMHYK